MEKEDYVNPTYLDIEKETHRDKPTILSSNDSVFLPVYPTWNMIPPPYMTAPSPNITIFATTGPTPPPKIIHVIFLHMDNLEG